MLEILNSLWSLVLGLVSSLWDVVVLLLATGWDVLSLLHTEAPRLEGLLVGIVLAWLMARRNKHPLLRVLSSPLKLVVDVLDLAWDQVIEVVTDLWNTALGWVKGVLGWMWGKVTSSCSWAVGKLTALKNRLLKK
jgi:phage-related protein